MNTSPSLSPGSPMSVPVKRNAVTWLFNPFVLIAGLPALLAGLVAILLAGWIGSLTNTHFDGVLDLHTGAGAVGTFPLWLFLAEGIINWLSLFLTLALAGLFFSKTKFRYIDLLGTQALARWPAILIALLTLPAGYHRFTAQIMEQLQKAGVDPSKLSFSGADAAVFMLVIGGILLLTIWMVYLMYRAFSVSCNLRGGKAIALFIGALILAEVISKVAIMAMFKGL